MRRFTQTFVLELYIYMADVALDHIRNIVYQPLSETTTTYEPSTVYCLHRRTQHTASLLRFFCLTCSTSTSTLLTIGAGRVT